MATGSEIFFRARLPEEFERISHTIENRANRLSTGNFVSQIFVPEQLLANCSCRSSSRADLTRQHCDTTRRSLPLFELNRRNTSWPTQPETAAA